MHVLWAGHWLLARPKGRSSTSFERRGSELEAKATALEAGLKAAGLTVISPQGGCVFIPLTLRHLQLGAG